MEESDRRLVIEAKAGDRTAFRSLVDRYRGRVYALGRSIANDHEKALELTRHTFVCAHRALRELDEPAQFPSWLTKMAYKVAGELGQHELRQRGGPTLVGDPQGAPTIEVLLAALPEQTRAVLDLRFREGLGYRDIAETLGVPQDEVARSMAHGMDQLRSRLRAGAGA
jgi:RNA polymerase sigma-70 factor, ECF subfamily